MDHYCRYLRVPCVLLRMVAMSALIGAIALYFGYGAFWSIVLSVASLALMQTGYFAAVVWLVLKEKDRRRNS